MTDELIMDLLERVAELERRLNDTLITGVVSEVQYRPYRVRVDYGTEEVPQTTALLPVIVPRAARAILWCPLDVGEAVMVISPNGNTAQGRVLPASYTRTHDQPDDQADRLMLEFGQGNRLVLNRKSGKLHLTLSGELEIDAPERLRVNSATLACSGDILDQFDGNTHHMRAMRDIYDDHTHTGDSGGQTSAPQQTMS